MSETLVRYSRKDHTAFIVLNRPAKMNALSPEMLEQLRDTWIRFQQDDDAWTAVLSGEGRCFCAGSDIAYLGDTRAAKMVSIGTPGIGVIVDKPIIAAIHGYCVAAGTYLAMNCDLRIAGDTAQFAITEARIGQSIGGVCSITRHVPMAVAMEMLFTADYMNAQRAYEVGFINRVVAEADLMQSCEELAEKINRHAPLVLREWKRLIRMNVVPSPYEQVVTYAGITDPVLASADADEGRRAFLEKRPPQFMGR